MNNFLSIAAFVATPVTRIAGIRRARNGLADEAARDEPDFNDRQISSPGMSRDWASVARSWLGSMGKRLASNAGRTYGGISDMNNCLSAMTPTVTSVARFARGRRWMNALATIGFFLALVALSTPSHAAQNSLKGGEYPAFGGTINIIRAPQAAAGTILARDYLTPQTLCGAAECSVASVWQCPANSDTYAACTAGGPTCTQTTNPGICSQLVINGQVSPGFSWTGTAVTINQPVEIRLVSTGATLTTAPMGTSSTENRNYQYFIGDPSIQGAQPTVGTGFRVLLWNSFIVLPGTCTVPDQTITLPPVVQSQFNGVGSTTGSKSFNLQFNNCPANIQRLGYSLIPVGAAVCPTTSVPMPCAITSTSANGVLPSGAGSTAAGVGIQVTDTSGSPVPFNYSIAVPKSGLSTAGSSYTVPLVARYIQTGGAVTPGSVSSQMQILLDYQ